MPEHPAPDTQQKNALPLKFAAAGKSIILINQ